VLDPEIVAQAASQSVDAQFKLEYPALESR